MSKRLAILAATTALVSLSHPAMAQQGWVDDSYEAAAETAMRGGHSWNAEPQAGVSWQAGDTAAYEAAESYASENGIYDYSYESREVVQDVYRDGAEHRTSGHHRGNHHATRSSAPRLAYSPAERAEWLAQCRSLHARAAAAMAA